MSHPFTTELMSIIDPRGVNAWQILDYPGERDLVQYLKKHESSLLVQTSDDNHFALFFLATLSEAALYWFFGLRHWSLLRMT